MSREFRLILRVLGADVDGTKKVPFGLSRIRGVGPNFAQAVVKVARISPEARIGSQEESSHGSGTSGSDREEGREEGLVLGRPEKAEKDLRDSSSSVAKGTARSGAPSPW